MAPVMQLFRNFYSRLFKTEDSRFVLYVGLKITGISFGITLFIYWYLLRVMKLNYVFFKAHGFPTLPGEGPFFDLILEEALDQFPVLFGFHIFLFFVGIYVGRLMLRPFKSIGDYCEKVIENPNTVYRVEEFSAYTLLTRFSEFFFEYLREVRARNDITTNSIPPHYSKIHKPVLDKIFMLHFGLLLVIVSFFSAFFIIENTSTVFESMVELATRTLKDQKYVSRFLADQVFIIDDLVGLTIVLVTVFYTVLGFHLYSKVSGAAFGIFSTMRAFMKGNHSSRVHLVGFAYVRDYTRKLNKYLDYIQNNFGKEKTKK